MKYTNNNNQAPPNLLGFWINNKIQNGIIIKKKFVSQIKIKNKNKEDDDDNNITKWIYYIVINLLSFEYVVQMIIKID
jgi:hypothetical protein